MTDSSNSARTSSNEAATRVRNTLSRELSDIDGITFSKPRPDNPETLDSDTFDISIRITATRTDGLLQDPEELVNTILSQTYLYNGTKYGLTDNGLNNALNTGADHEIDGAVTVTPVPT